VYAGTFTGADGVPWVAAISVGRRPTFYEEADLSLLEAYLLDFDGDLYGQPAAVRFLARIRGQQRFDQVDDLVRQMDRDVADTRRLALGW
jgi:riboflavin kinase/FMN adenylyltransferase